MADSKRKKTSGYFVTVGTGEKIQYNSNPTRSKPKVTETQKQAAEARVQQYRSAAKENASTQSGLSKPAKITSDVSVEAWTRATPSQTKLPSGYTSSQERELSQLAELRRQAQVDLDTDTLNSVDKRMKEIRAQAGKQTGFERVGSVLSGSGKLYGGQLAGTAGTLVEGAGKLNTRIENYTNQEKLQTAEDNINRYQQMLSSGKDLAGKALTAEDRKRIQSYIKQNQAVLDAHKNYTAAVENADKETADTLYGKSLDLIESGSKDVEKAKEDLGFVGRAAVDLGVAGTQMAADAALGTVTGTALIPMFIRSFGGGAIEAKQNGATYGQQLAYGALSAGTEVATEKISNVSGVFKKVYGGGVVDEAVKKAVKKLSSNAVGQALLTAGASAGGEGFEEFVSDVFAPIWQRATYAKDPYVSDKYGAGNIDLKNRPQYQNADGTISTVDSWSFNIDGKEVLLPSVWMKDGKPYHSSNADEILRHYKETGEYLGKFDTVEQANAYAKKLHQEQNQYYNVYQNAKFDLGEAMYDAMIGAAMGLIGDAGNIVNTTRPASVDNRGVKNAGNAVDVSPMNSDNAVPPVDAQTAAQYNDTTVSPAASAEVQQTEAQAQVTQAENPGSTVLDAATTLFTQQGMKLKTAQEKAAIVQKLIAGEEVSVRDINTLNPTSKESQAIFTQLTGVQFPEGKVTQEQLYTLYRSANTAAVQAREQQRAQQQAQEAAFQQAAAEQVQSVQEQQTPTAQQYIALHTGENDAQAVSRLAQMRGEIAPDGNALLSFKEFSDFVMQQNPKTTREATARLYDQYLKDNQTVEYRGQRISHMQFMDMVRNAPTGSELTEAEAEDLWQREVKRQQDPNYNKEDSKNGQGQSAVYGTGLQGQSDQRSGMDAGGLYEGTGRSESESGARGDYGTRSEGAEAVPGGYGEGSGGLLNNDAPVRTSTAADGRTVFNEVSETAWSEDMKRQTQKFSRVGIRLRAAVDRIPIPGTNRYCDGVSHLGVESIVQSDSPFFTFEQLCDHEVGHQYFFRDRTSIHTNLYKRCVEAYKNATTPEQRQAMFTSYLGEYADVYAQADKKTRDQLRADIREEIICDAYAGMNRNGYGADQLQDAIKPIIDEWCAQRDAEMQTTEQKYSIDSMAEAVGLTFEKDGQVTVFRDAKGNVVDEVTEDHIRKSPLGAVIQSAVDANLITKEQAGKQVKFFSDLYNMMLKTQDIDLLWAVSSSIGFQPLESGPRDPATINQKSRFAGYTNNADPQYSTTVDFTTICVKTQAIIDAMSETMMRLGRGLTEDEIVNVVYKNTHEAGEPVPCPVCYVFSRWVGLGGLFEKMNLLQTQYENVDEAVLRRDIDELERRIYDIMVERGYAIKYEKKTGKPKLNGSARDAMYKEMSNRKNELTAKKNLESLTGKKEMTAAERTELEKLNKQLDILDNWTWLRDVRLSENYEPVPPEILYNINAGKEFAEKYPESWKFRTTRGPAMGKAATPYADEHLGQILRGAGVSDVNKADLGDPSKNPFLKGKDGELTKTAKTKLNTSRKKIKAQNLLNGQRYQSTSDFRFEYALDYLLSFVEMQALGGKVQLYTKVAESVPMFASVKGEVNCSLMPLGIGYRVNPDGSKTLVFSSVTGMNAEDAFNLSAKYDNVQPIMVGVNNEHIRLCMADDRITFIIPYHASGASEGRYVALMKVVGESVEDRTDYSEYQSDHVKENATPAQKAAFDLRSRILTGKVGMLSESDRTVLKNNDRLHELYKRFYGMDLDGNPSPIDPRYLRPDLRASGDVYRDPECFGVTFPIKKGKVEIPVMPFEYWDRTSTIDTADAQGEAFIEYCESLGLHPRFSGWDSHGVYHPDMDLSKIPGYWKFLGDRALYNNDGTYHEQQAIDVTNFNADYLFRDKAIKGIVQPSTVNDPGKTAKIVEKSIREIAARSDPQTVEASDLLTKYSIREEEPPKKVIRNVYKAFYARDGKLYPPMVANMTDDEKKTALRGAVSGTMKSLDTPVGVWLNADIGKLALDSDGNPVRNTKGRLAVVNEKGGGTLAFRPGWHLGEWPDAKQFNKDSEVYGKKSVMPDGLVFARCEIAADVDYQLDAMSLGMKENGKFDRTQAGLPMVPVNGYYKYRTNVDPTTAPWYITGAMRVVEILDDDDCAAICEKFGVKPSPRESGKKIDLSEYGLKRGPVTATENLNLYKKSEAIIQNESALQTALNDPAFAEAYTSRALNFEDEEIRKEFARNRQNADEYREKAKNWKPLQVREGVKKYSITPEFEQWYKENFGGEDLTDAQLQRRLEYAKQKENDILVSKQAAKTKQDVDQRYKDLTAWMMYHERKMREQRQTLKDRSKAVQQSMKADNKDALEKQAEIHKAELAVARDEKVKALKDKDLAWRIYSQQQARNAAADKAEALKTARKEANAEKAEAVRTTKEVERAKAEVQHDADMMAMKREAAKRLRIKEDAYQQKAEQRKENQKLKRNAAKQALRDSKLAAKKRAEAEVKQGAVDTIRKNPASRSAVEKLQERASQLRTLGRSAYRTFVNQALHIDELAKRQVEGTRASTLVTVLGGANDTVATIYKNGLVDRAGNTIGESMKDVFLCWDTKGKKVDQNKQALLQDYMLHQHNVDRMSFVDRARTRLETFEQENPWLSQMDTKEFARLVAMTDAEIQSTGKQEAHDKAVQYARLLHEYDSAQNKPIFGDRDGNAVTADTSRKIVQQYLSENPWLEEKAQGIYDWWDKFMRTWAVGDSITETEYNTMRELYPHYVPTYRADKKGVGAANFVGADGASIGKAVKKAKGGMSEVLNIEDSFSNLVSKIVRLERTNELYMNMIDSAMLDNDDTFSDMIVFDWDWQDGQYGKTLEVGAILNGDLDARYDDAETAGLSKVGQDRKLTAWHNGRQYSAYVSEDLFKSIANVTGTVANDIEKAFIRAGNALTGPMKTAITGINPFFAVRNLSRDLPTAITNSISGMAFPKYWAQAAAEIAKNSENWQHFQALGGTNATYYNDQNGFVNGMEKGDGIASKIVGKMGAFNEVTEAQTRFAEYLATIDRLGDTYENRLLGIKNAAEVTVDFSRKGRAGKLINAWVPYWNPAVQGVDKIVRSVIDSPDGSAVWKQAARTVGRASMTTVLLEAILYAVLKGIGRYDDWEELDDRTKDTYYCIPYGKSNTFIKVPKNREWGAILGTPFMRLLEYANGRENPFENYIETSLEPNFLPGQILAPREGGGWQSDMIGFSQALDLQANKDFAGRTIVPYSLEKGSKELQYDESTSWFAKKLGELIHFSPMQIDYIITDYFGNFGDIAVTATSDAIINGTESLPEKFEDVVKNQFVADNRKSNYVVSKYYDTLEQLDTVVQDRLNQLGSDAYKETVEYQTKTAMDKLFGKQISELNKRVREAKTNDERMNLKGQIALIAGQALEYYQDCMDGKVENPVLDAQYANLPSAVSKELIRLDGYSKDYGIKPTGNPSAKYTDPKNKNKEYVLTAEQKDKFKEIYQEQYAQTFAKVIGSSKYKSSSDEKKANLLENARDDVLEDTKDEFFKWLKKTGAKSTAKKK